MSAAFILLLFTPKLLIVALKEGVEWINTATDRHREKQIIHVPMVPSLGMNSKESGLGGHSSLLRAYQTSTPFSSSAYVLMLFLKDSSFPHSPRSCSDLRPAVGSTHRENEREQITCAADESFQSSSSSSSHGSLLHSQPVPHLETPLPPT